MKTCMAYLKPNQAKHRWKTYVSKASGCIPNTQQPMALFRTDPHARPTDDGPDWMLSLSTVTAVKRKEKDDTTSGWRSGAHKPGNPLLEDQGQSQ